MNNKTNLIPKEDIAKMYHCDICEVNCLNCRFANFETVNLDTSMINCWLWKTSTSTRAFCTHYQPKITGGVTHDNGT